MISINTCNYQIMEERFKNDDKNYRNLFYFNHDLLKSNQIHSIEKLSFFQYYLKIHVIFTRTSQKGFETFFLIYFLNEMVSTLILVS